MNIMEINSAFGKRAEHAAKQFGVLATGDPVENFSPAESFNHKDNVRINELLETRKEEYLEQKRVLEYAIQVESDKLMDLQKSYYDLKQKNIDIDREVTSIRQHIKELSSQKSGVESQLSALDTRSVKLGMAETNRKQKNIPSVYTNEEIDAQITRTDQGRAALASATSHDAFMKKIKLSFLADHTNALREEAVRGMAQSERGQLSKDRMAYTARLQAYEDAINLEESNILIKRKAYTDGREKENDAYRAIEIQKIKVANLQGSLNKLNNENSDERKASLN